MARLRAAPGSRQARLVAALETELELAESRLRLLLWTPTSELPSRLAPDGT
jgi:hypothetical protein